MSQPCVITALGPITPAALGLTSMHEHLMFDGSVFGRRLRGQLPPHALPIDEHDKVSLENVGILQRNVLLAWDALNQDDEALLLAETADFKAAGGGAMLELSVPGVRLDTGEAKRISAATGVHIILSSGFYTADSWPPELHGLGVAGYYERMTQEIERGIGDTGCYPGHLKIALETLERDEEHALRAAAQVASDSGLSLTIHPSVRAGGDSALLPKILQEEDTDLSRVILAHTQLVDRPAFSEAIRRPELYRVNIENAKRLLDQGLNLSLEFTNSAAAELLGEYDAGDWAQLAGLTALLSQGYAGQLVLGNDCCGKIMLRRRGGEGYCRLFYYTLPMLRETAGVSEYALKQMLYENPARLLAIKA